MSLQYWRVAAIVVCLLFVAVLGQSLSPRVVRTKQGSVKGVLVIPSNRDLQPVEAFLGLPYASPPVGSLRFMPPVSPLPWNGVRLMDKYAPACPQTLADVSNEREALRHVTRGRLQYLRRLLPYLRNQSEDCLYLNIYAPVIVGSRDVNIKFPVMVFIHGESFEWNSGNPYDGSILASYGDVVVVTLNFRLGVLGFLRPDLRENRVANFGLLDQIAALQWIQENIAEFGGDATSVTLLGHGTGAACANLLLLSPVAQGSNGLFHRAILMSGTALADWAIVDTPLRYTLQAAGQVDCPLAEGRDDDLAACLRSKRVTELMGVRLQAPLYANPLAPLVDGIVVPNEPRQSMKTYNQLFGRYDVMYGVTQSESFHLLNAATLQSGLTETERNRIIRTYVRNSYSTNIDQVTAAILNEYTDWRRPVRDTEEYRDSILDILGDARVVAPVIQMADLHSALRQRSYFYVFAHQTLNGDFPQTWGSIHGEDLAYVFGMPLVGGTNHLSMNYTRSEMLLSEIIMTAWTNFARTGNPNFPPRHKFLTASASGGQRDRFDPSYVQWPAYDRHSQKYLSIELRPKVSDHYRAEKMALWSKLIPELLSNTNNRGASPTDDDDDDQSAPFAVATAGDSTTPNPALMGAQPDSGGASTVFPHSRSGNSSSPEDGLLPETGGIALSIVIVIGMCFLVLNVCACAGVFYQRDRVRFKEMLLQRQFKLRPAAGRPAGALARGGHDDDDDDGRQSSGTKMADEEEGGSGLQPSLAHETSTSTMDPHTKVSQWMGAIQEMGGRSCTPRLVVGASSAREGERDPPPKKTNDAGDVYGVVPAAAVAASRSATTGRRKRTKSRSSSLKRDVAVGDDGDRDDQDAFSSSAATYLYRDSLPDDEHRRRSSGMETIRRLNLPRVLPDLGGVLATAALASEESLRDDEAAPAGQRRVVRRAQRESMPMRPVSPGDDRCAVVVAARPRRSSTSVSSWVSGPVSEPDLVVRPGAFAALDASRKHQQPDESVQSDACHLPVSRPADSSRPTVTSAVSRRSDHRHSRLWYPRYSQSLTAVSQADQVGDDGGHGVDET